MKRNIQLIEQREPQKSIMNFNALIYINNLIIHGISN